MSLELEYDLTDGAPESPDRRFFEGVVILKAMNSVMQKTFKDAGLMKRPLLWGLLCFCSYLLLYGQEIQPEVREVIEELRFRG